VVVTRAPAPDPPGQVSGGLLESGSVFLELPDGRLTVVLRLDGTTWIAWRCDAGIRG